MKRNISIIKDCFGCGVCTIACGKGLIHMRLDTNGFYKPFIDNSDKCVECNRCISVCSCNDSVPSLAENPKETFAAWSNNPSIRQQCSSGGVGYEIARCLLKEGYQVASVRYNVDKERAEHYIANSLDELIDSIGSKYLQSFTENCWAEIRLKGNYLITGTPCQIDSMRRYARMMSCEDKFVFMDFFCHGVPSYLMWKEYLKVHSNKHGKITNVKWRNKKYGWHDSWCMTFHSVNGETHTSRLSKGDLFYKLYLGDFCNNIACRKKCKYKYTSSAADIRIGDCWGRKYNKNTEGVSSLIVFTDRGKQVVDSLGCVVTKQVYPLEVIAEYQMRKNANNAYLAWLSWKMLHSSKSYNEKVWSILVQLETLIHFPQKCLHKFLKIVRSY